MDIKSNIFNQLEKKENVFTYCVFYDEKIPCKQAKLPDTDLLVLDVIADFELSVTVVNVVSYISRYILRRFMLQSKCLDCLRML